MLVGILWFDEPDVDLPKLHSKGAAVYLEAQYRRGHRKCVSLSRLKTQYSCASANLDVPAISSKSLDSKAPWSLDSCHQLLEILFSEHSVPKLGFMKTCFGKLEFGAAST